MAHFVLKPSSFALRCLYSFIGSLELRLRRLLSRPGLDRSLVGEVGGLLSGLDVPSRLAAFIDDFAKAMAMDMDAFLEMGQRFFDDMEGDASGVPPVSGLRGLQHAGKVLISLSARIVQRLLV